MTDSLEGGQAQQMTIHEAIEKHVQMIRKERELAKITRDTLPAMYGYPNDFFFFLSGVLERLLDPTSVLEFLQGNVREGFLEFTLPLVECCSSAVQRGVLEHQHTLWVEDDTLHILPKFQFHPLLLAKKEFLEETEKMVSQYPHYRVGHYHWSADKPLKFKLYSLEEVPDLQAYTSVFLRGVLKSVESTNLFLTKELLVVNDSSDV